MSSEEAATWLMEKYPITDSYYGSAFRLLGARYSRRADQRRLAGYYLQKLPFATSRSCKVFCSLIALATFLGVVADYLPASRDMGLLRYHLETVLNKVAKSEKDCRHPREECRQCWGAHGSGCADEMPAQPSLAARTGLRCLELSQKRRRVRHRRGSHPGQNPGNRGRVPRLH